MFIYERVKRKVIKLLTGKFDEVDRTERDALLSELQMQMWDMRNGLEVLALEGKENYCQSHW